MSNSTVGKAVYGNQNSKKNWANANWQIQDNGSHLYRILPPFGLLAAKGQWAQREAIHWGYKSGDGKMRPFRCIQRTNPKTKMVIVECPQCTKIAEKKKIYDNAVKKFVNDGKSQEEAWKLTEGLKAWLDRFNLDFSYSVNALRPEDNQIGKLKLKTSAKKSLDEEIKRLQEKKGIEDPLDPDTGVLFDFQRSGAGRFDTKYAVTVAMENVKVGGEDLERIRRFPLTQDIINRMGKEAFELATSFTDLNHDQIALLVSSNGDASIVDSVFGAGTTTKSEPEYSAEVENPEPEDEPVSNVVVANTIVKVPEVDAEEAALMAQLKAYQAKKSAPSVSVAAPKAKVSAPVSEDEAFIDSLMDLE